MIRFTLKYYNPGVRDKTFAFPEGVDGLSWELAGGSSVGKNGIDSLSADLLTIALTIYHTEKFVSPSNGSPIHKIVVRIPVYNKRACELSCEWLIKMLAFMNSIPFEFIFSEKKKKRRITFMTDPSPVEQVVLFSGGMDSTCGIATYPNQFSRYTKFVSYYTRQQKIQRDILQSLGYNTADMIQLKSKLVYTQQRRLNHHFSYRAFMFLAMGSVFARSFGAKTIYQFENGVLANAVPPYASISMTKHAHPITHKYYIAFIESLFGEKGYTIINPFLYKTKREMAELAGKEFKADFGEILTRTETCWYIYSNFSLTGKAKEPNRACGICIPCLIRRTADENYDFQFDISSKKILANDSVAFIFRSYEAFVKKMLTCKDEMHFYMDFLDGTARESLQLTDQLDLKELYLLYKRFSKEFEKEFLQ
ncbi:MAG TPA: hypothetical protein VM802_06535 [Chitinophaga sp.]|uniref:7-cyano-7-deazaguanine synthase n=1 Tax=Chitinophaga sp. TaxID=1869181 RepID=UPI002D155DAF|nr:hypothetical protein [Chitinophaga sp.]HVI44505.1 hypothetical protein [Chitinophaga sp.]